MIQTLVRKQRPRFRKMTIAKIFHDLKNPNINKPQEFLNASTEPSNFPKLPKDPRSVPEPDIIEGMSLRLGDMVRIRAGPNEGQEGVICDFASERNLVYVRGMNLQEYTMPHSEDGAGPRVFISESPINVTLLQPLDPVTHRPTSIRSRTDGLGNFIRLSRVSGCAMPPYHGIPQRTNEDLIREYESIKGNYNRTPWGNKFVPSVPNRASLQTMTRVISALQNK